MTEREHHPEAAVSAKEDDLDQRSHRGLLAPTDEVLTGLELRDPSAPPALYGDDTVTVWYLNSLGRPASRWKNWGRVNFGDLRGEWLTTAKDLALLAVNPEHPSLPVRRRLTQERKPNSPTTVEQFVLALRDYHSVASWGGYPASISDWEWEHFDEAVAALDRRGPLPVGRLRKLEFVPRLLHSFRDVIPGAPRTSPWPKPSKSPFAGRLDESGPTDLQTDPVDPDIFFSLLKAALAYVQVFSPDIIKGQQNLARFEARKADIERDERTKRLRIAPLFDEYFDAPNTLVPMRSVPQNDASDVDWAAAINWDALVLQVTGEGKAGFRVRLDKGPGPSYRARAVSLARGGAVEIGGLVTPVERLDDRIVPWSTGLDRIQLGNEIRMLRSACYIVIAGLTMMRDSEVQELRRGCLTTYLGTPAVRSELIKGEAGRPVHFWWVSEPVVDAIRVLEQIAIHPTHLFSSSRDTRELRSAGISPAQGISVFRRRVNETSAQTGLDPIPDGAVTPHMLRRTMALITERERGGQLAARHQLKHAFRASTSNSLTGAYTGQTQRWAAELKEHQAVAEARDAIDALALAPANKPVGPGASRLKTALRGPGAVLDKKSRARMLAQEFPDLRIGSANACLGDRAVAKCLTPEERERGENVRPTACDPARCANSVLLPLQEPLWEAEEKSLQSMMRTPRLSAHTRAMLAARLEEVQLMTKYVK